MTGCHSPSESKLETTVISVIACRQFGLSPRVGSDCAGTGVVGREAEYAQHLNKVRTQQQTMVRAQQDVALDQVQSSRTSVVQPVWPNEMLARMKEFDGDDDKFLAEYQQDIQSGQAREVRQEFKGCVAQLLRVCLQAEREWVAWSSRTS